MIFYGLAAFVAVFCFTVTAGRLAFDRLARWRHWRIGRWSLLLPGWREEACRRCGTSYRYVRPHGTPCTIQRQHGFVLALCEGCWRELGTPSARIEFYERVFKEWAADDGIVRTVADLHAVRAAVAAGL